MAKTSKPKETVKSGQLPVEEKKDTPRLSLRHPWRDPVGGPGGNPAGPGIDSPVSAMWGIVHVIP